MNKLGIVLSGGGSKGAYQIGVWKALKKIHIKYDIVTGTSVGALNGLLMVQKDYKKALNIWENMDYKTIFGNQEFDEKKVYKSYLKKMLKSGGIEPIGLENLIKDVYNYKRFISSNINFGIVTVNLTKLEHENILKKDMTQNSVIDYVLASSTCYPVFKAKKINKDKYIDGGYYDNLPINLCAELGAKKIISIDTKAIGIKRKLVYDDVDVINISPNNEIIDFLKFDNFSCKKTIDFGYNDTLKYFNKKYGKKFTFNKFLFDFIKNKKLYKMKKMFRKINVEINNIDFINLIEEIGVLLNIEEHKIYSLRKYNKLIKKNMNLLDDKTVKSFLTQKINTNMIRRNQKEFIISLYLKTI